MGLYSDLTLHQQAPELCFQRPSVEMAKAQVECCIHTICLGGPGHAHPKNWLTLKRLSKSKKYWGKK